MKILNFIKLLEYSGYRPATEEDEETIKSFLKEDIELKIDNLDRVWTIGNAYVANVIKIEEKQNVKR